MTPARWRQVEDLYHRVLEVEPSRRRRFLEQVVQGDDTLGREVASLLDQRDEAASFLEVPAPYLVAKRLADDLGGPASSPLLASGTRLGPYEIGARIGAGGMGEVYRARDTRLDRTVAIKVLRFESSPERQRFEREARAISRLNHPNVCVLHDIGQHEGLDFLVMEYLEGETLSARLARGPLPLDEALECAIQIADALDKAHGRGVVHRDVKPGNIQLTRAGAKLLDFGLADIAAKGPDPGVDFASAEPPLLGTRHYMAPEQLGGASADARTDIWALGATVFEMVTGRKAFEGGTPAAVVGAILEHQPPRISTLRSGTPPSLDRTVERCLAKDPAERWPSAGDVTNRLTHLLDEIRIPHSVEAGSASRRRVSWGLPVFASVAIAALLVAAYLATRPSQSSGPRSRLDLQLDASVAGVPFAPRPAISPDGRSVAFTADTGGEWRLFLRQVGSPGTRDLASADGVPFWSPDSRSVGFLAGGRLKTIDTNGGPPRTLCNADGETGAWSPAGVILFEHQGVLYRVAAAGGSCVVVRPAGDSNEAVHRWPAFLPDGRRFLYVLWQQGRGELRAGHLDSDEDTRLFPVDSRVLYADPGYLLFANGGRLMARAFDPERLAATGDPFPVAADLADEIGASGFSVSAEGSLAYGVGSAATTLLGWYDRDGRQLGARSVPGILMNPHLSSDGARIAVERQQGGMMDIWLTLVPWGEPTRVTFDGASNRYPVFSPDGKGIAFVASRRGRRVVHLQPISGTDGVEPLAEAMDRVSDWSLDGQVLLTARNDGGNWDVWVTPATGASKPYPLFHDEFREYRARFSPDGRWIAYISDESGRNEVYVQDFPPSGRKRRISVDGGEFAVWRRDGRAIVFNSIDGGIHEVDVTVGARFEAGSPRELFRVPAAVRGSRIVVTPDAEHFLVLMIPPSDSQPGMTVVRNWSAGIEE